MDEMSILKELKRATGADNAALVGIDGLNLAADTIEGVMADSFSIMCATMLGAAATTTSELKKGKPELIHIDSIDAKVLVAAVGPRAFVVLSVPKASNVDHVKGEILKSVDKFAQVL